jgi:2-polyprenyl-6-methoxyphenol hydroxylase-like FAD-dependent oxidoreductase
MSSTTNVASHLPSSTFTEQRPILIIGAGLAGLSLAQALRQHGIPFRIFERDDSRSFRAQGYRIRISSEGAASLQRLLPNHLYETFEGTCAPVIHGGHALDALTATEQEFNVPGGKARGNQQDKAYNADRAVLRGLLMSGLEDVIEFGKKFDRFEAVQEGVVAHFIDGTFVEGSVLIGADGARSIVRRQLLPDMQVLDTEGRAVFGKTPVTATLRTQIPQQIGDGLTIASVPGEGRMKLFTDGMVFDRQQSIALGSKLRLDIPADYIYWVLVFRHDVVPIDDTVLMTMSCEQAAEKSLELTGDWHDGLKALFRDQMKEAASTLAFLTSPSDLKAAWSCKTTGGYDRVTLLGDSGRPMPPVGGLGANAAFQDSVHLFSKLKNVADGEEWGRQIAEYEQEMLDRAQPIVDMSAGGAAKFFGAKPVAELKPAAWH